MVDEPLTNRLERVVNPPLAVRVPVKLAVLDIVCPFISPEVIGPAVRVPMLPDVANRFVEDAVVAKKLVVVALVPVAVLKVKFCRVVEPRAR